jgi:VWFA-related protein
MTPLPALAVALATQAPPVFATGTEVVRVEVLVTRGGAPVRGLSASDFELRDDGRVQELEPVLEEETGVDAVLVLDVSGSVTGPKLESLRAAAGAFLDGLGEGDRAAVLAFHHEVSLLEPLTGDLGAARSALGRAASGGITALVDAVYAALRVRAPDERRMAVVVFSDGLDNTSWLPPPDVLEVARRSNATVYGVTVRARKDRKERFLGDVARATGGRLFEASSERDLRERFLEVLEDIRARYVLRFTPDVAGQPGWHALGVRLRGRKGELLARPGYWRGAP